MVNKFFSREINAYRSMRFDLANRQAFLNSKLHQRFRIGRTQRRAV